MSRNMAFHIGEKEYMVGTRNEGRRGGGREKG